MTDLGEKICVGDIQTHLPLFLELECKKEGRLKKVDKQSNSRLPAVVDTELNVSSKGPRLESRSGQHIVFEQNFVFYFFFHLLNCTVIVIN